MLCKGEKEEFTNRANTMNNNVRSGTQHMICVSRDGCSKAGTQLRFGPLLIIVNIIAASIIKLLLNIRNIE